MERLDQFLKLALLVDTSGHGEPCAIRRYLPNTD